MTSTLDLSSALAVRVANTDVLEVRIANTTVWTKPVSYTYSTGWESGADSWTMGGAGGTATVQTATKRTGAQAMRFYTSSQFSDYGIQRTITGLTPGKTYEARCWVLRNSGTAPTQLRLIWDGVAESTRITPTAGTWNELVVSFTASFTSQTLQVWATSGSSASATYSVYVDDLTVQQTS